MTERGETKTRYFAPLVGHFLKLYCKLSELTEPWTHFGHILDTFYTIIFFKLYRSSTFFFMLILLGIDSQFATVEVIITTLKDGFSDWIDRYIKYHEVLVLLVCILGFLFGIPHVFNVSFQKNIC